MATLTHRGITYTTSGSAAITVDLDLPLWAGVDQDDGTWLAGGATAASKAGVYYPGTLGQFEPRQSDGTNKSQPRVVCLQLGNLADAETLTLSGDCNAVLTHMSTANESVAADVANNHHRHPLLSIRLTDALVLTATCKRSDDGATGDTTNASVWLIVA